MIIQPTLQINTDKRQNFIHATFNEITEMYELLPEMRIAPSLNIF